MALTPYWLLTGVSGFIGGKLLNSWAKERPVVGLSRREVSGATPVVQGDFHSIEDLHKLDSYEIAGVVHLAAVTGGCSEEDGLAINVQGTRQLLRYLIDRGCRRFLLASSIAVTGCLDPDFLPLQLPIPDDHPCLARDAYGFSKASMEELAKHFYRIEPTCDFKLLRFGAVVDDECPPSTTLAGGQMNIPFAELARVYLSDILQAIEFAIVAPHRPGVHIYNVVGPDASCADAVSKVLATHYGERLNRGLLSRYDHAGHQHDALYTMQKIKDELGFVPRRPTRTI